MTASRKFWFDTIVLPDGVEVVRVTGPDGSVSARFEWQTRAQHEELVQRLAGLTSTIGRFAVASLPEEPPEVRLLEDGSNRIMVSGAESDEPER